MNDYKQSLTDGLPQQDGSYLLILKDESTSPQLFVRYTNSEGIHFWISTDRKQITDDMIVMYKKILITPFEYK